MDAELRELLRREGDSALLVRGQLDGLLEIGAGSGSGDNTVNRIAGGVLHFSVNGKVGGAEVVGKMSGGHRRMHRDGAGGDEIDIADHTHVLVRRCGIPVDPVDSEIGLGGRKGLHRKDIVAARLQDAGDIEIVRAIRAGDLRGIGDAVAVQPDLSAVVDAAEVQPELRSLFRRSGRGEVVAVPPAAVVGAVGRHGQVRKIMADGIRRAGNFAQVVAKVRIGQKSGGNLSRNDSGRQGGSNPAVGGEARH